MFPLVLIHRWSPQTWERAEAGHSEDENKVTILRGRTTAGFHDTLILLYWSYGERGQPLTPGMYVPLGQAQAVRPLIYQQTTIRDWRKAPDGAIRGHGVFRHVGRISSFFANGSDTVVSCISKSIFYFENKRHVKVILTSLFPRYITNIFSVPWFSLASGLWRNKERDVYPFKSSRSTGSRTSTPDLPLNLMGTATCEGKIYGVNLWLKWVCSEIDCDFVATSFNRLQVVMIRSKKVWLPPRPGLWTHETVSGAE